MSDFDEYLRSRRCKEDGCENTATHRQNSREVCNTHLDRDGRAFALND